MSSPTTLESESLDAGPPGAVVGARPERAAHPTRPLPSRVLFVGPLETEAPCGSTVKNNLMVRGLEARGIEVHVVDTGDSGRSARLAQLGKLLRSLISYRQVVVSASRNGVYTLVPLLGALTLLGYRFAILVTGSGLPRHVSRLDGIKQRYFRWSITRASGVFAEGDWIGEELQKVGVFNSHYLPNPRPRPAARWDPSRLSTGRLTYISRVIPEKGVEHAIQAVEALRREGNDVTLEVYGPVPAAYREAFDALVERSPGTTYHGVLDPDDVSDVLAEHAALVFPTTLFEGMPGILVEAAMVGMPVISSTITPIAEFIEDGVAGRLVEAGDVEALAAAIEGVLSHPDETVAMAEVLGRRIDVYSLDNVSTTLCDVLAEQGWR